MSQTIKKLICIKKKDMHLIKKDESRASVTNHVCVIVSQEQYTQQTIY